MVKRITEENRNDYNGNGIEILVYGFTIVAVIGLILCCAVVLLVPDAMG